MGYFDADTVITEHISDADIKAYFVGFEYNQFRYDALIESIMDAIVDFSFGFHEGILKDYKRQEIVKASRMLYKIEDYDSTVHSKSSGEPYSSEEEFKELRYYRRGEFGELILHLLLREFMDTVPLLAKMYLKDSVGTNVKGIDAVHIGDDISDSSKRSLYLGESKLHRSGTTGVDELLDDVEAHFCRDFLEGEFLLVGNKKNCFLHPEDYTDNNTFDDYWVFHEEKNEWYDRLKRVQEKKEKLDDLFSSITIPMICTYTSKLFENHNDELTADFKAEFEEEVHNLHTRFRAGLAEIKNRAEAGEPISTDLNVVLMLFPVPDKKELVKQLHQKLYHMQRS